MNLQSTNFVAAIKQICDEKKISAESVLDAIKEALKAAYRKDFGNREQNLEVLLDKDTGKATILLVKTIVEEVENKHAEISLKDARRISAKLKVGAKLKIDVTPLDYGRIASQSAKQVIIQKVQEAERMAIYEEYRDRSDELLNALIHRVEGKTVYLELDRTTATLEARDQIPRERYQPGQRTKVYLEKVEMTSRGSMLKVSRTHPRFIFRLMELEIPEVRNGTVIVKAIARDPGTRCKIIVDSIDENVDHVGDCVGQRGVRIQNITDEVNGERIDVIEWSDNFETLLKETLSPAKIDHIIQHEAEKRAEVYVAEDQRALAIGKNGQNVRLASEIMGWDVDILNTAEIEGEITVEDKTSKQEEVIADTEGKVKKTPQDPGSQQQGDDDQDDKKDDKDDKDTKDKAKKKGKAKKEESEKDDKESKDKAEKSEEQEVEDSKQEAVDSGQESEPSNTKDPAPSDAGQENDSEEESSEDNTEKAKTEEERDKEKRDKK